MLKGQINRAINSQNVHAYSDTIRETNDFWSGGSTALLKLNAHKNELQYSP